jgi:hypothetical protein
MIMSLYIRVAHWYNRDFNSSFRGIIILNISDPAVVHKDRWIQSPTHSTLITTTDVCVCDCTVTENTYPIWSDMRNHRHVGPLVIESEWWGCAGVCGVGSLVNRYHCDTAQVRRWAHWFEGEGRVWGSASSSEPWTVQPASDAMTLWERGVI